MAHWVANTEAHDEAVSRQCEMLSCHTLVRD